MCMSVYIHNITYVCIIFFGMSNGMFVVGLYKNAMNCVANMPNRIKIARKLTLRGE